MAVNIHAVVFCIVKHAVC